MRATFAVGVHPSPISGLIYGERWWRNNNKPRPVLRRKLSFGMRYLRWAMGLDFPNERWRLYVNRHALSHWKCKLLQHASLLAFDNGRVNESSDGKLLHHKQCFLSGGFVFIVQTRWRMELGEANKQDDMSWQWAMKSDIWPASYILCIKSVQFYGLFWNRNKSTSIIFPQFVNYSILG